MVDKVKVITFSNLKKDAVFRRFSYLLKETVYCITLNINNRYGRQS